MDPHHVHSCCLCNLPTLEWWSLAVLKCNQSDLKDVWIRTSLIAVFLQSAWKPCENPPKSRLLSMIFPFLSRSLWHSLRSLTFIVRKHELKCRRSMAVMDYRSEAEEAWIKVFGAGCLSKFQWKQSWWKIWFFFTQHSKIYSKCLFYITSN